MGQGLFKKHSKFQNFDEIFYCRDQAEKHEFLMSVHKNLFQERKIWDRVCLKTFKISNIQ